MLRLLATECLVAAVLDSFITVYTYARDCDSFSTGTVSVHAAPH